MMDAIAAWPPPSTSKAWGPPAASRGGWYEASALRFSAPGALASEEAAAQLSGPIAHAVNRYEVFETLVPTRYDGFSQSLSAHPGVCLPIRVSEAATISNRHPLTKARIFTPCNG